MHHSENQDQAVLKSDCFDALQEALELLYIRGNMSGRLQFLKEWPDIAYALFGPELIRFDTEGGADKTAREELENAAEENRLEFLSLMETLEEKSVHTGALRTEYVGDLV